ncbi:MAG: 16S rRNA (uracil(1498)-N(3))-methyltransferase [Lachnospiraceae bacterium]|nr:16S rRNA (uracil(1498)-N(3))-methyltransferase [Lachnospiraceae bacterium]
MYQFFVEPGQIEMEEKRVTILGSDVNHIKNVLRMKIGEEIAVSNGMDKKDYRCGIADFTEDSVICELRFIKDDGLELPSQVYLFQGLPKADKMELIVQKAVELGVHQIIPMATKRAIVKLDEKKAKNKIERWQGIAEASAKQSKRRVIPQISQVMSMKEAVALAKDMDVKIIPYELAEGMAETKKIIENIRPGQSVAIFIGPEGGFEDNEIQAALENGIQPITLGKRILRTETAGFTTLAWIMYQLEE